MRTFERRSVMGKAFEKPCLINRQRLVKSSSPGGNVHTHVNYSMRRLKRLLLELYLCP